MKFYFVLFLFFHMTLYAYDDYFHPYQARYTQEEIAFRLKHFLQKNEEIENHYLLTDKAFYLFASKEDKIKKQPEFTLQLAISPQIHLKPDLPHSLKNYKIAIDPGHLGGDFAILEQRYVKMVNTRPAGSKQPIFFKEGTLALMTALLLKQWFEEEGAQVLLTKEKDGQAVYSRTFFEWLATEGYKHVPDHIKGIQLQPHFNQLFSNFYNRLDLHARAQKINAFHPHLTLIIHYNSHGRRDPITQDNFPENYNYNMVFIGGSFCKGELATRDNRKEFLRLLLTNDLDQSLHLSRHIIHQFTKQLDVPHVQSQDPVPYLTSVSMQLDDGIYARNLFLTRMVHGPLCYGESLCQDHHEECIRLNNKDFEVNDILGPKRVEQVAKAYYRAVKDFIHFSQINQSNPMQFIGK